jgi:autotransporter-associated beta strand protein
VRGLWITGDGSPESAGGFALQKFLSAPQARTITNNVAVNGIFTVGGFNNATTFNGGMDLGGGTRTISLDNSATIGGSISNGGLMVASSLGRTLTLSGSNSYTGATTVNSGTLLVNNTTGSGTGSGGVSVASGATLGGSGTIAGATAISGTLSPGNSPGVLTFGSDLSLNTGGNMVWELWGNTEDAVLACSALKEAYRQVLATSGALMRVIFLEISADEVESRLRARKHDLVGKFQQILAGQFRDLEKPKNAIVLDAKLPNYQQIELILALKNN